MRSQHIRSTREQSVENKWAPVLQSGAPTQQYQEAYEELQKVRRDEGTEEPAQQEPTGFDKLFIDRVGTGKTALEIGFGDGIISFELARRGNTVVGIEVSELVLERARERLSKEPDLNLRFEHGDARVLDFEDDTFDYVVSRNLVEHLSVADARRHMDEVWRVLKRDGCYLFYVPNRILFGYRSAGYHLNMYCLKEAIELAKSIGFEAQWIEPKLKWLGKGPVPSLLIGPAFWYEGALERLKAKFPGLDLRIGRYALTATVLIAAHKTTAHKKPAV